MTSGPNYYASFAPPFWQAALEDLDAKQRARFERPPVTLFGFPTKLHLDVGDHVIIVADWAKVGEGTPAELNTSAILDAIDEDRQATPRKQPPAPYVEIERNSTGVVTAVRVHDGCGQVINLPVTDIDYAASFADNQRGSVGLTLDGSRVRFTDA